MACTPGAGTEHLTGCFETTTAEIESCAPSITGPGEATNSVAYPAPLEAGGVYEIFYETIRVTVGDPISVDVYGADSVCGERGQHFGTLTLDPLSPSQRLCIVADAPYAAFVYDVHAGGVVLDVPLVDSGGVCSAVCTP